VCKVPFGTLSLLWRSTGSRRLVEPEMEAKRVSRSLVSGGVCNGELRKDGSADFGFGRKGGESSMFKSE